MIAYRRGTYNRAADALSRHPDPPTQVMALSYSVPLWLEKV
jgi:hypothetical protein